MNSSIISCCSVAREGSSQTSSDSYSRRDGPATPSGRRRTNLPSVSSSSATLSSYLKHDTPSLPSSNDQPTSDVTISYWLWMKKKQVNVSQRHRKLWVVCVVSIAICSHFRSS